VLDATAVRGDDPPRVPQDESARDHDPLLTDAHAAIEWARSARELHD
jgi:hypothetical protein